MLNFSAEEARQRTEHKRDRVRFGSDNAGESTDRVMNMGERSFVDGEGWTLPAVLATLRRQARLICVTTLIVLALAAIYVVFAPARYTATASLVTNTTRAATSQIGNPPDSLVDASVVESQIETLKSQKIGLAVIDELKLWKDPEFVGPGLTARFLDAIGLSTQAVPTTDVQRHRAMAVFSHNLKVVGLGHSYIAEISFTSLDPRKAAAITNAIATAYIEDQLGASFANARRASAWMQERLAKLRDTAQATAQAVSDFKSRESSSASSSDSTTAKTKLKTLEETAHNANDLYQTMMNRYARVTQFMQQQSFPVTEARVITQASPPPSKSSPKSATILFLALVAGGTIGIGAAFGREAVDTSVRSREQIERRLGILSLGGLDRTKAGAKRHRSRKWRMSLPSLGAFAALANPRPVLMDGNPFSPNANVIRRIKLAIDHRTEFGDVGDGQSIGIISPHQGEGRTTVALNLATLTAKIGHRTLLLDCDLRNPVLMRMFAPNSECGLLRVLWNKTLLRNSLLRQEIGFDLLGEPSGHLPVHPADILSSSKMAHLLAELRRSYDYVFVDLPPVLDHVDVAASASLFDAFVLVAEWGRTTLDDLEQVIVNSDVAPERIVGVVMNKVGPRTALGL